MKKLSFFCALLTILVIIDAILYLREGVSLSGYWSDKILVWLWIAVSTILITKGLRQKLIQLYLAIIVTFLVLCALPMMIPLLSILGYTLAEDRNCVFYPSPNLRVQEDQIWIAPGRPSVKLIKQGIIFEKVVSEAEFERELLDSVTYLNFCDAENIKLFKKQSDSIQFQLEFQTRKFNKTLKVESFKGM